MHTQRVRDAMEALLATNPEAADRDELADHVRTVRELRTYLDAYEVRCARRSRELAELGRAEPPTSLLANHGGHSSKEAATAAERERVASQANSFEGALGNAEVSAGHLDALAVASKHLDASQLEAFLDYEDDLLGAARSMNVDAFARECRGLARQVVAASTDGAGDAAELDRQRAMSNVKRWVDKSTGMHHSHLELDPVSDAIVWGAIDAQLATVRQADGNARTPWKRMQVDAVIAAVGSGPGVDRVPEIMVLTDHATLVDGLHANSVCETVDGVPLPVSTVRRLCCDANIVPAVLGSDGEILDVGRVERTANRAQRRALRAMHRTCADRDCTVGFSACRIHHVKWWWRDLGPTDIANLLPLCERHHHLVHEGGWTLTMTADRVVTWIRPDGTVHHIGSSIDRAPRGVAPSRARGGGEVRSGPAIVR
jgi:hypothetical protein